MQLPVFTAEALGSNALTDLSVEISVEERNTIAAIKQHPVILYILVCIGLCHGHLSHIQGQLVPGGTAGLMGLFGLDEGFKGVQLRGKNLGWCQVCDAILGATSTGRGRVVELDLGVGLAAVDWRRGLGLVRRLWGSSHGPSQLVLQGSACSQQCHVTTGMLQVQHFWQLLYWGVLLKAWTAAFCSKNYNLT